MYDQYRSGKAKAKKLTYDRAYHSWYALLANKVMYLFQWEGLPEPMHQREIEYRLQFSDVALCAFVKSKRYNRYIAADATGFGVTEYRDMWKEIIWTCPGDSGINDILDNPTAVLIRNNSTCLPCAALVERYANLLAHAELSLQAILINSRSTGILAARDDRQRDAIMAFYAAMEDGRTLAIVDDNGLDSLIGSEGLRQIATTYPDSVHILDFWQARQNLYKEFLAELGISKSTDKRERLISDEVMQDYPLYQFNLDDMLRARQEACKKINDLFGLSISVKINPAVTVNNEEVVKNETGSTGSSGTGNVGSSDDQQ
jgi:hypothetical protein